VRRSRLVIIGQDLTEDAAADLVAELRAGSIRPPMERWSTVFVAAGTMTAVAALLVYLLYTITGGLIAGTG
jgi:hypothetical protein